jgi:hypothetical protein
MKRRDRTYPYLALQAVRTSLDLPGDAEWTAAFTLHIAQSDAMPAMHPDVNTRSRDAAFVVFSCSRYTRRLKDFSFTHSYPVPIIVAAATTTTTTV